MDDAVPRTIAPYGATPKLAVQNNNIFLIYFINYYY